MKAFALRLMVLLGVGSLVWMAGKGPANAQTDALVSRGEYIAKIAGCISCHTPFQAAYLNPETLSMDQIKTLTYEEQQAQDFSRLLSGGRVFPLGPAGIVISRNLTPDAGTGLGNWSDEQIEIAIRTGQRVDGRVLFPLMPYHVYNGMSDEDMTALLAYLRSIPAVSNLVSTEGQISTEGFQPAPMREGITTPDKSDQVAYGGYLVQSVLACTDCHTPIDPSTGAPILEKYLGGGQPYEGPWGIVYGGNITPDMETGIGSWSEEDLKRALIAGVRPEGRRLAVMPWETYKNLNGEDVEAVIAYLQRGVKPVKNAVPASTISPEMLEMVEMPATPAPSRSILPFAALVAGAAILAIIALILRRRRLAK
jgi:mono/diheme cytochrome c family protein